MYGYAKVAKTIESAKSQKRTRPIDVSLDSLWKQVDPDRELARIKGITPNGDFLEHPDMLTWIKYADDFNKTYPEKAKPLLDRLKRLDDGGDLVNVLFGPVVHSRSSPDV